MKQQQNNMIPDAPMARTAYNPKSKDQFLNTRQGIHIFTVLVWTVASLVVGAALIVMLLDFADVSRTSSAGGGWIALALSVVALLGAAVFNSLLVGVMCLIDIRNQLMKQAR